ncbi:MAG: hypothetical protein IKG04_01030, partial [Exiguobacterium sp.]|nr:hypothetical protein [Exiguobacterium sp.]
MTYEPLTANHAFQVGDRISLKVDEAGEKRDGFITEFEDGETSEILYKASFEEQDKTAVGVMKDWAASMMRIDDDG